MPMMTRSSNRLRPAVGQGSRDFAAQSSSFMSSRYRSRRKNNKKKSTKKYEVFVPKRIIVHALRAFGHGNANQPNVVSKNQVAKIKPNSQQLHINLSSMKRVDTKVVSSEQQSQLLFKVNQNVEVLSQDSGLRGCWFKCKILQCSKKFLKVEYYDVLDVDGPGKQKERVPSSRVANYDKLSMRCVGRFTVRPWPFEDLSTRKFEIGAAVDAWWCDGWWEGVVIGRHLLKESKFQVYIPGENITLDVERENLRASKDWVENKWIDIKEKPDILSLLPSILNPTLELRSVPILKLPSVPIFTEATTSFAEGSKDAKLNKAKSEERLHFKKRLLIRNNEEVVANNVKH